MRLYRVLMIIDSLSQSGSYWRYSGPFANLAKTVDYPIDFHWIPAEDVTWEQIERADAVFMHRPYAPAHKKIVQYCMDYKTKIWIDIDDDIFHIPFDNATYQYYMDRKAQNDMISMVLAADVVTVSTTQLKRVVDKYRPNKDCIILKNSFLKENWSFRKPGPRPKDRRVMWRGSHHHQKDLMHVKDDIIKLCNEFKDWWFIFVGFNPWYIFEKTENCSYISPMRITEYFKALASVLPDITMVPLYDNGFNRCKSNIAALEGIMAGSLVVAPSWEEWMGVPGVINYGDSFYETMKKTMTEFDQQKVESDNEAAWEQLCYEYDLTDTNMNREIIFDALFERNPGAIDTVINHSKELAYGPNLRPAQSDQDQETGLPSNQDPSSNSLPSGSLTLAPPPPP